MRKEENHFAIARSDFQKLKKNHQIPPQMEVKLQYLLAKIAGKEPQGILNLKDLPEYEKNSLDQISTETGVQLFCNIVNCLSGKEVVLYFRDEKAYIRKDETFSMWSSCYLTCDSTCVMVSKKPEKKPFHIFQMVDLRLSSNYRVYKKKVIFGAAYKKKDHFLIGFDLQNVCERTHKLLRNLIREKVAHQSKESDRALKDARLSLSRASYNSEATESKNPQGSGGKREEEEKESEGGQVCEEGEDKAVEMIRQYERMAEENYSLKVNEGNYREFIHKKYPNRLKQVLLMEGKSEKCAELTINIYLHMAAWNPEVEDVRIKTKISEHLYLLEIKIKKYSYLAWPRGAVAVAEAVRYKSNYFLVIKAIEEDPSYTDAVRMEWNQIIEICEGKSENKLLVTVVSDLDFKGYCSVEDSQNMGLKVMRNIKLLEAFMSEKQLSGRFNSFFNFGKLYAKKQQIKMSLKRQQSQNSESESSTTQMMFEKVRKMSNDSEFELPMNEEDKSEANQSQMSLLKGKNGMIESGRTEGERREGERREGKRREGEKMEMKDPLSFIMYMMKNDENSEISQELIEKLKEKAHERYYLKHKFDQQPHLDVHRLEHTLQEPNSFLLQNGSWKINEEGDTIFINKEVIEQQKDVIKMIVKQLGSNIMSGKSIMNMSLPVEIFDGRSILERCAMGFGYAPKILIPAGTTVDVIEQAKMVTSFIMGIGVLHLNITKPFNPILGETFQCIIGGIPLSMEQISHHPPISAFYMKTEQFSLYGSFHSHAEMGLNYVYGRNLTPIFIQFPKTRTLYEIKMADIEVHGMVYGDKRYRPIGRCFIHERTNNIFVEYSVGKDKKKVYEAEGKVVPNLYYGGIYTVTDKFANKFRSCENKKKFEGLKPDDIIQTHASILAHWALFVSFNKINARVLEDPLPNRIEYPQFVLPSDSNFRTDIIYKRLGDLKIANQEKQILENIQRRDRKLREGKEK